MRLNPSSPHAAVVSHATAVVAQTHLARVSAGNTLGMTVATMIVVSDDEPGTTDVLVAASAYLVLVALEPPGRNCEIHDQVEAVASQPRMTTRNVHSRRFSIMRLLLALWFAVSSPKRGYDLQTYSPSGADRLPPNRPAARRSELVLTESDNWPTDRKPTDRDFAYQSFPMDGTIADDNALSYNLGRGRLRGKRTNRREHFRTDQLTYPNASGQPRRELQAA